MLLCLLSFLLFTLTAAEETRNPSVYLIQFLICYLATPYSACQCECVSSVVSSQLYNGESAYITVTLNVSDANLKQFEVGRKHIFSLSDNAVGFAIVILFKEVLRFGKHGK